MKTRINTRISLTNLDALSSYARYLLESRLDDYVHHQISLLEEVDVPLMKYFRDLSYDQLFQRSRVSSADFLTYLANNKADEQIAFSIRQWKENELPGIKRDDIQAEDITLVLWIRKKTLTRFINDYTSAPEEILELVNELDYLHLRSETALTNTYINLLKEKISEDALLIEKVNETIPGVIYVFDVQSLKTIYSNNKLGQVIGYSQDELNNMGEDLMNMLIHPEDQAPLTAHFENLKLAKDGEVRVFKYRIRDPRNNYRWLSNFESVFKRDEQGNVIQTIGLTLNVDEEERIAEAMRENEQLHKRAEALTHLGSFSLNMRTNRLTWSDEVYRIHGLEPQIRRISYEEAQEFILPEDRDLVREEIRKSIEEKKNSDFYYRIHTVDGKEKIMHARASFLEEKDGTVHMLGTLQDVTEKQTLIRRLRQSERLYKQAQALARLGNWMIDLRTQHITWSEEMYHIYEADPNDKLSISEWMVHLPEEERKEVMDYYEECLRERKSYDKIHHILTAGGKIKTLHRKGEFILDEKGEPIQMIGTTQDVTEEYRIQQELKENQTFIRKITDATPSVITSYHLDTGKYVFISRGLEKLLGYLPEEVMDEGVQFFTNIIHPEDRELIQEKNREALEEANAHPERSDLVVDFVYRMRHKKGYYHWFHTYGTIFDRNAEGKVEHVLNITLDINDQIEATEKVKEQEHFIQQIADASPTILYLFDVSTQRIEYINREIFFVLGYLPEEILDAGESITELIYHPDDYHLLPGRKLSGKSFQQVDSMIQYECRMRNKEGEWRWLLVREIVFKTDENGNISQILGAALDINRRKDMERTILQNTLQLEQSNASLEEFAYVASHDLKEPLRKISTFGDRLVASQMDNLQPDGKMYLKKIIDASQRMQTMINDLLSISMITGNTAFERHSLQTILNETLQTLEYKIEQLNAVVNADPLPEANIIPSQFRQLFQNLLSNSFKFIKPDVQPVINIRYTLVPAHKLTGYQLSRAAEYHQIEFSDNGIGFEMEFAGKIFAIFQRLHGRSEYEGSGIGLAICKKIVEHHGGSIFASGEMGQGAKFTIIIPA